MSKIKTELSTTFNQIDLDRWNAKYRANINAAFQPQQLLTSLQEMQLLDRLPAGPILELACGLSGNVIALANAGYQLLAVDISDHALHLLEDRVLQSGQTELLDRINLLQVDLNEWLPPIASFALVFAVRYWHSAMFTRACHAVMPGGLIAWQTFTQEYLNQRPSFRAEWCLAADEPASLLPQDFSIIEVRDLERNQRRLIARRR